MVPRIQLIIPFQAEISPLRKAEISQLPVAIKADITKRNA
ncbi:unnamed protein product [Brugia timori]|uniref:Uncharacterized protein n=1 Tax=Brugia timori TaxID=42155 RepID=A0A3P7V329_9BILA|nr:unnamed protein product [Brugia timori]